MPLPKSPPFLAVKSILPPVTIAVTGTNDVPEVAIDATHIAPEGGTD